MSKQDELPKLIRDLRLILGEGDTFLISRDNTRAITHRGLTRLLQAAELSQGMPERADDAVVSEMMHACAVHIEDPAPVMRNIYGAIRRHLMRPKPKMVEVWRVEWAAQTNCYPPPERYEPCCRAFLTNAQAEAEAQFRRNAGATCVRVTGPHQQEVPA